MSKKSKAKLQKLIEKKRYLQQLESSGSSPETKAPIQQAQVESGQENGSQQADIARDINQEKDNSLILEYYSLKDLKRTVVSVILICLVLAGITIYYHNNPTLKSWGGQIYRFLELEES